MSFICKSCGNEQNKWSGRCICGQWNTIVAHEEKPYPLAQEEDESTEEKDCDLVINLQEVVRVCTFRTGSLILLGGEPGIGKSTLLCQIAHFAQCDVLYLSGEETVYSVKKRFCRLFQACKPHITVVLFTFIDKLETLIKTYNPKFVILDSISTTRFSSGDYNMREIIFLLSTIARKYSLCLFILSHITKEGNIAGPKTIEHMVDVVLYMENPTGSNMRFLKSTKNRFGSTNEIGIFEMTEKGLQEYPDRSLLFLTERKTSTPGSVVFIGASGNRAFLIEVQSLIVFSPSTYVESIGFSSKRLNMILAILQKEFRFSVVEKNIFVSLIGGITTQDPAADLPVAISILSSIRKIALDPHVCFFGELSLTGEIRAVNDVTLRIREAQQRGFTTIYSAHNDAGSTRVTSLRDLCKKLSF